MNSITTWANRTFKVGDKVKKKHYEVDLGDGEVVALVSVNMVLVNWKGDNFLPFRPEFTYYLTQI